LGITTRRFIELLQTDGTLTGHEAKVIDREPNSTSNGHANGTAESRTAGNGRSRNRKRTQQAVSN
jgi:hypothetical protein